MDVAVFRTDQQQLRRHLAGWSFEQVVGGVVSEWGEDEWLEPPVHELHARSPSGETLEFLLTTAAVTTGSIAAIPGSAAPPRA